MVDCLTIKAIKKIKQFVFHFARLLEKEVDNGIERVYRKQVVPQANEVVKERTKEEISTQLVAYHLRKFERAVKYLI